MMDMRSGNDLRRAATITFARSSRKSAFAALGGCFSSSGGMSPEFIRERLFKPFQTTKQAGMGIGAYESFQYVQELGGRIDVQSEPDKGTEVTLRLPLFEAHAESELHMTKVQ